jgi:putative peptidoglycan binding protein/CHAP domain-containing protein
MASKVKAPAVRRAARPPRIPAANVPTVSRDADAAVLPDERATGEAIVRLAERHLEEKYVLGARAPMADPSWKGPWDCAEFASWCLYQSCGILFGVEPRGDPVRADAYSGFWSEQSAAAGAVVAIEEAARVQGAIVVRSPATGRTGHVAISDGKGGTVEAHSSLRGVCRDVLGGRRWTCGVLVPGVRYLRNETPVVVEAPPGEVLRVTQPLMAGPGVERIQRILQELGFFPGRVDGVYGPQTESAVQMFQASAGIVPDGEVGSRTLDALKKAGKA